MKMHANKREEIKEVYAGDIVAALGFRNTATGDTLCDPASQIVLEAMDIPQPVISVAIEPRSKAEQEKLGTGLAKIAAEDPTFIVRVDEETSETIVSGMGELHLEIIVDRLLREFKVNANVGKPQVAYRETITGKARAEGRFVRQSGGRGQFGHVWLELEPLERGSGFEFVNRIVGGVVPREYIGSVERGVREALAHGSLAGYPLVDIKVSLVDRRGRIMSMETRANVQVIESGVPLAEMFGYATDLRSATQGRATFHMQFSHYDPAPLSITEEVKAAALG
jgi:elongation factor G